MKCLEKDRVGMSQASDDIFFRQKVELKIALNKISTCNESTRQEAAFWLKTNEVSV